MATHIDNVLPPTNPVHSLMAECTESKEQCGLDGLSQEDCEAALRRSHPSQKQVDQLISKKSGFLGGQHPGGELLFSEEEIKTIGLKPRRHQRTGVTS